jgi:hypothetical protein
MPHPNALIEQLRPHKAAVVLALIAIAFVVAVALILLAMHWADENFPPFMAKMKENYAVGNHKIRSSAATAGGRLKQRSIVRRVARLERHFCWLSEHLKSIVTINFFRWTRRGA